MDSRVSGCQLASTAIVTAVLVICIHENTRTNDSFYCVQQYSYGYWILCTSRPHNTCQPQPAEIPQVLRVHLPGLLAILTVVVVLQGDVHAFIGFVPLFYPPHSPFRRSRTHFDIFFLCHILIRQGYIQTNFASSYHTLS